MTVSSASRLLQFLFIALAPDLNQNPFRAAKVGSELN